MKDSSRVKVEWLEGGEEGLESYFDAVSFSVSEHVKIALCLFFNGIF